ncbi:MAG: FISUMP domain-containing protein [Chitinophagaceae bacterium]
MKHFLLSLALLLIAIACKKSGEDRPDDPKTIIESMAALTRVQSLGADVYAQTLVSTNGDSLKAVNATAQFLVEQASVDKVYYWSTGLLEVQFKSGLRSHLVFVNRDARGQHLTRGGGGGDGLNQFAADQAFVEEIPNKKVLILNPYMESQYQGVYNKQNMFPSDFTVDVYNNTDVTFDRLNVLDDDYGLVILNTHGLPNGFFLRDGLRLPRGLWKPDMTDEEGDAATKQVIDSIGTQMKMPLRLFETGELEFNLFVDLDGYVIAQKWAHVSVTDKWIRNSSLSFNETILYGNHCWSGYTYDGPTERNLPEAWKSKGVAVYYGYATDEKYSGPVLNNYAMRWEDSLILHLLDGDSTGVAHLGNNNSLLSHTIQIEKVPVLVTRGLRIGAAPVKPLYFSQFFSPHYSYEKCGDTLVDRRDGQKYPTACIGDQRWMAANLNWAGAGICYNSNAQSCATHGRLYTITEVVGNQRSATNPSGVKGICPEGWHVPSLAEYEQLVRTVGGAEKAKTALRSRTGWPTPNQNTDAFGFKLTPSGMAVTGPNGMLYQYQGQGGYFWTTTKSSQGALDYGINGYSPNLGPVAFGPAADVDYRFSCRCVKDK